MCNNNSNGNCICELLNVILILQQNACTETSLDSCDRPILGGGPNCLICNTRPVMLYTCGSGSTPLSMPTSKDTVETTADNVSSVFRVEKLDNNCATFRVLTANPDTTGQPWLSTNSLFTLNLDCCCACRCLSDCYVDCI